MKDTQNSPKLPQNKMGTRPVGGLLITMALPLILSMIVQALYNIVDSIYVSQISESAVTALSLAFPIQNLQIGCAVGAAVGTNSFLSQSLGQGNREQANRAAGNGILLTLVMVGLFMIFGAVGARPYFEMQSSVTETVEGGTAYTTICCLLTGGIFIEILGERLLQASGRTVYTLYTQGAGAVLNILLDPVFIFGFEPLGIAPMGIAGAAVATVIGQWVAAIMAVAFNLKCNKDITFALRYIRPQWHCMKKILAVGIPSMIMMAIGSVMTFAMNQVFLSFPEWGETPAAVFGVYFKLQSFVIMPVMGLNNACISIVAYNYGAQAPSRITKVLKYAIGIAMGNMLLGVALFQLAPNLLLNLFDPSPEFRAMGVRALQIVSLHFPLAAIGIVLGACFQALGNGIYSTITSLCRQLIVLVPAAYLLSLSGQVDLVWWSFPIAEVVSMLLSIFLYLRIYRKQIKPLF